MILGLLVMKYGTIIVIYISKILSSISIRSSNDFIN